MPSRGGSDGLHIFKEACTWSILIRLDLRWLLDSATPIIYRKSNDVPKFDLTANIRGRQKDPPPL